MRYYGKLLLVPLATNTALIVGFIAFLETSFSIKAHEPNFPGLPGWEPFIQWWATGWLIILALLGEVVFLLIFFFKWVSKPCLCLCHRRP